jgi:LacI family transcriptional regulator
MADESSVELEPTEFTAPSTAADLTELRLAKPAVTRFIRSTAENPYSSDALFNFAEIEPTIRHSVPFHMLLSGKPTVALLIETSRGYGRELCLGIAEYARQHGEWNFVLQERDLRSGSVPEWLSTWKGDGILCRLSDPALAAALAAAHCPVVDTYGQNRHPEIPFLDTDAEAVANMAARFFVNSAFTNFAFCGFPGLWFSDDRSAAFEKVIHRFGSSVNIYHPPLSWKSDDVARREALHPAGSPELEKWILSLPPNTAILACNDIRAQQLLRVAERIGRQIPEDLAVMGVDDDEVLCELTNPRLTSIKPDARMIGYTAAHWLHQLMLGKKLAYKSLLVPPLNVNERASTDVIASDDKYFVTALRYIRNHVQESIDVNQVVAQTKRSRSSIESRFKKFLGRSIKDEIIRTRIARSAILLRETSMTLQEVAVACGFVTASHFCRVFKQTEGVTPSTLRNISRAHHLERTQKSKLATDK